MAILAAPPLGLKGIPSRYHRNGDAFDPGAKAVCIMHTT
jgi:hypothetical protein